jgi:hypothetical protein
MRTDGPESAAQGDTPARVPPAYRFGLRITEQGDIVSVGDGIARLSGLPSAAMSEVIRFAGGSRALVFGLDEDGIGAIMLEGWDDLAAGDAAFLTGGTLVSGTNCSGAWWIRSARRSTACPRPG